MLSARRSHWGIENKLHWVLDNVLREDKSCARKGQSAENLDTLGIKSGETRYLAERKPAGKDKDVLFGLPLSPSDSSNFSSRTKSVNDCPEPETRNLSSVFYIKLLLVRKMSSTIDNAKKPGGRRQIVWVPGDR